jgi:ADP-dependent NAD(P)H-hydrate dehydratase / NAD(P)H-hydrate epimerase
MKISTVAQMRELDRSAIDTYGIPGEILMENAGIGVFQVIHKHIGVTGRRFVVLCGAGNNGGDGFVVARKILSNGGAVIVFTLGDRNRLSASAAQKLTILEKLPVDIAHLSDVRDLATALETSDVIVDAIFGTGLTRDVSGIYRQVIDLVNASGKPVISVDIPSGVSGDTGRIMGVAVKADYTVTFGLPKIGSMVYPGAELVGMHYVCHISFPPDLYESENLEYAVNVPLPLPRRQIAGHKGTFGDVLFVAGAVGYFGAPYFCAMSFLKAGGGYARLATPRSVAEVVAGRGSEIVFVPQDETPEGSLSYACKPALLQMSDLVDMAVIGPGLSLNATTQQLVRELVAEMAVPILLDGDGITAACSHSDVVRNRSAETVLTPHLGELSRLTGSSIESIQENLLEVSVETAGQLRAYLVVKGAHTLVVYPDGRVFINLSGNDGMATAGSGDVLAGAIAAMMGLGLSLPDAVRQGVFVHGLAGDLAAEVVGRDGVTAGDILAHMPGALRLVREQLPMLVAKYGGPEVI